MILKETFLLLLFKNLKIGGGDGFSSPRIISPSLLPLSGTSRGGPGAIHPKGHHPIYPHSSKLTLLLIHLQQSYGHHSFFLNNVIYYIIFCWADVTVIINNFFKKKKKRLI
jgi:hypothetical protein